MLWRGDWTKPLQNEVVSVVILCLVTQTWRTFRIFFLFGSGAGKREKASEQVAKIEKRGGLFDREEGGGGAKYNFFGAETPTKQIVGILKSQIATDCNRSSKSPCVGLAKKPPLDVHHPWMPWHP